MYVYYGETYTRVLSNSDKNNHHVYLETMTIDGTTIYIEK